MPIGKGMFAVLLASVSLICAPEVKAQGPGSNQPDRTLTAAERTQIIDTILSKLKTEYVFPETAKKMDAALRKRLEEKEYDSVTSAKAFAGLLTTHLQEVSKDKHLRVRYSYEALPGQVENRPTAEEIARFKDYNRRVNYGFEKVERLSGNIGYVDLRGFFDPETGGDTVASTMDFLANTDALIIDLRHNGGGDPAMVQLLCSYFFEGEPVHLNDLYFRPDDSTHQYWTLPHVPGKRYVGKEVYLLTSKSTFSGAEEFSYNMKNLKRATLIGETTGGGAHPGGVERINEHFSVFVPVGRAINPITKTNWEGTGVTPHVPVPADQALKTAHVTALKKVLEATTDPRLGEGLKEALDNAQKELASLQGEKSDKSGK
jgi:hypothetical protein